MRIAGGPKRGYIGIVTQATDDSARVELHATCKTVTVKTSDLREIDKASSQDRGGREGISYGSGSATPSMGANTPHYGSQTPAYGSQTPMYGGGSTPRYGSQTPIHDSNRTPSHGSSTPAHEGSRTPGYDGSRTPGYDGSRTPGYEGSGEAWDPQSSNISQSQYDQHDDEHGNDFNDESASGAYDYNVTPASSFQNSTPNAYTATPTGDYTPASTYQSPYNRTPNESAYHNTGEDAYSSLGLYGSYNSFTAETSEEVAGKNNLLTTGILVKSQDNIRGVITSINPDGTFTVQPENDPAATQNFQGAVLSRVDPTKDDQIKILQGEFVGRTGKLINIDGNDGIVQLDAKDPQDRHLKILNMDSIGVLP